MLTRMILNYGEKYNRRCRLLTAYVVIEKITIYDLVTYNNLVEVVILCLAYG